MAFSISAGEALDFHCTDITCTTLLGFFGAASRKAAAAINTAQTARMLLLLIIQFFLSSGIPV
jgi:Xaa-Pro aminopeptidase